MNFSLKPHQLLARWVPGFIVALAAALPLGGWDARVLTNGGWLFLMAVAAFVIGQLIDSFRDCVVEKLLDKVPGEKINWDFFLHCMDHRASNLENYCVYYVFNANTVLAAAFGLVVMGVFWLLGGARRDFPSIAPCVLALVGLAGMGLLLWKAIKLRGQIAALTRGFITGLPHYGVYARLKPSKVAQGGVGLFAIRRIPKSTPVFLGDDSHLVSVDKSFVGKLEPSLQEMYDDICIVKDKGKAYGCPKNFNQMSIAWYVNHSDAPNVVVKDHQLCAARDIEPGEELTADYRTFNDFDQVPDYMRPRAGEQKTGVSGATT
jgi:hypothetical protein